MYICVYIYVGIAEKNLADSHIEKNSEHSAWVLLIIIVLIIYSNFIK